MIHFGLIPMVTDYKTKMIVLLSFLVVAHCTTLQSMASGERVEPAEHTESLKTTTALSATAAATTEARTGRKYYQPTAVGFVYHQPYPLPQRRAYRGPAVQPKKRPLRKKTARRPGRLGVRARMPQPQPVQMSRFRRLPTPVRAPQVNYIDTTGDLDYNDDGYESAPQPISLDYERPEYYEHEPYGTYDGMRKRPAMAAYADEPQAIMHVPVRVQVHPAVSNSMSTTGPTAGADSMDKLRQMVREAMHEHFANRHQELYADGFEKQRPVQYSAKSKRLQADKENKHRTADAVKSSTVYASSQPSSSSSSSALKKDASRSSQDSQVDGSDDRLTLTELSAYLGAKPSETILSAGGQRYELSDALQHSFRQQQQQQQQQQQHQQQYVNNDHREHFNGNMRYDVSLDEENYEYPSERWMYK